jgi:hypothetical protein
MYLPAMITSVALGLLLANLVAHLIVPWRRVLDREAREFPGQTTRDPSAASRRWAWSSSP